MLQPLGSGPLAFVHKATIAIAIPGLLAYALWEGRRYGTTGELSAAAACAFGIAGAALAAMYLRALLRQDGADGR
jgi:hypothetical protein